MREILRDLQRDWKEEEGEGQTERKREGGREVEEIDRLTNREIEREKLY